MCHCTVRAPSKKALSVMMQALIEHAQPPQQPSIRKYLSQESEEFKVV